MYFMKVEIKMVEIYNDEEKFAKKVAETMEKMDSDFVKYALINDPKGNLYSAMIIKMA